MQRPIERAQIQKLLETGKTDLLEKFISRKGRPFKAYLAVDRQGKVGFEFEPRQRKTSKEPATKEPPVKLDFTGQQPLGKCPKCGGKVFEADSSFLCERAQAPKKPCKFKINKTILQQVIEKEQVQKLLQNRKTDLLQKFISKTGNPFPAYLVMNDAGKVAFEFPPREEMDKTQ